MGNSSRLTPIDSVEYSTWKWRRIQEKSGDFTIPGSRNATLITDAQYPLETSAIYHYLVFFSSWRANLITIFNLLQSMLVSPLVWG